MKKTRLLVIFVILLAAVGVFFYLRENKSPTLPGNSSKENGEEASPENQADIQEIMKDVVLKIGKISPVEPVLGGSWYPIRFWFVKDSDKNFYVEYEDGHILRRILLNVEKKGEKLNYKVIGYFEPGESGWLLKSGTDTYFDKNLDLYEHDEESGLWVKKN